jgi:hypothetical protein
MGNNTRDWRKVQETYEKKDYEDLTEQFLEEAIRNEEINNDNIPLLMDRFNLN